MRVISQRCHAAPLFDRLQHSGLESGRKQCARFYRRSISGRRMSRHLQRRVCIFLDGRAGFREVSGLGLAVPL